jgi:signal transduction histidine kinase
MSVDEVKEYLKLIVQAGFKMSNIVDELLVLAGVRRQGDVETTPLDMSPLIVEVRRRLTSLIDEFDAEIRVPEDWPMVLGHGPWIEEVWVNYISNAIKHGGRPPRLELGFSHQGNGVIRFWVSDNGEGLNEEQRSQLFTPFSRLNQARTKGHGLGLSIVARIMERLGGDVGVRSEVGKGSTFFFTLHSA